MTDQGAQQTSEEFRTEARAWLEANCPAEMRDADNSEESVCWGGRNWSFQSDAQKVWLDRMASKGWNVPTWPVEFGGGGLTRDQEKILREEMASLGARVPLHGFGIGMLGPALLKFGTEAQKQLYLPPIARGEIRWCQGYSEPGAGSDLASVQTKAETVGDNYVINGQKIWTSYADKADWMFALVRTDRDAPKHRGITFLLLDMTSPGVSTRPIRLISGRSPFCETFFDDVEVPRTQIVGEENRGWDVAKYVLTHERAMISGGRTGLTGGRPLASVLEGNSDPFLRAQAVGCDIDMMAMALTLERYKDKAKAGSIGDASSMLKYYGTELNKRRFELMMAAAGADALEWNGPCGSLPTDWLRTKANSIEGGTSEIMLSVIAKRVLEMPS
ncbi:MAG: acyl-CoA dehydrogenase family protein [Alphaproteobacteria bacterium]|nr:acyl-CoA dehydrogenase family protein [Alphaproteobacteria bacterium]MBO6862911.1 acyl-CoA dehydrogenase family protein [Alphaproteobacteria bacterium]